MAKNSVKEIINITDKRKELIGKVNFDDGDKADHVVEISLIDTQNLNDVVENININNAEKRKEILGKFDSKNNHINEKEEDNLRRIESKIKKLINLNFVTDKKIDSLRKEDELLKIEKIELKIKQLLENVDSVEADDILDRTEIIGKFNIDSNSRKHSDNRKKNRKDVDLSNINFNDTIALDGVVKKISSKKIEITEKRSEIVGKFGTKKPKEEDKDIYVGENLDNIVDEVQENVENISIAMIICIVIGCGIVGTIIGYLLYKIAMNNSNVMTIMFNYFINSLHIWM